MDQCTSAQVQSFNEDAVVGEKGRGLELDTTSPCEVSLNAVALFDPGLVSSSRMLTQTAPYPAPLITCNPRDSSVSPGTDNTVAPAVRPAWMSHDGTGRPSDSSRRESFVLRPDASILSFVNMQHVECLSLPIIMCRNNNKKIIQPTEQRNNRGTDQQQGKVLQAYDEK